MVFAVLGFSVPVFVVGYLLAYVFALQLDWLPVQGFTPISDGRLAVPAQHLILPTVALGLIYIALIARITRATMLDVLSQDYMRTAQAKGVGQRAVLFVHALKNAAVPIVTVIGIGVALLIGGVVVTESVFAIPGLGRLTVDAILRRDYPVIQGVVLLFCVAYVLVNLVVDLLLHGVRSEDPVLSATSLPAGLPGLPPGAAAPLPDVLPPVRQRGRVMALRRRHPTIVAGGALLRHHGAHRDLRALARHRRSDRAGAGQAAARAVARSTGSAPTCSAATSIAACSTARACR